jgi:hypothetical protein
MNKCKNPECQKEIPDSLNYCNESCLKRHIEIKKLNKKTLITEHKEESATDYMKRKKAEKEGKAESIKKPIQLIRYDEETINEIIEICDVFGFKHTDGVVSGSHNATILGYLRQQQEEVYSTTVDKLTWLCHMSARYLKENYLKGIEAYGVIQTFVNEFGVIKWRWIGIKALRNNGSM